MKSMTKVGWIGMVVVASVMVSAGAQAAVQAPPAAAPGQAQPVAPASGSQRVPLAAQTEFVQALRAAGSSEQRLDELFDKLAGEQRAFVGEVAGGAWKRVFLDPATADARRKEAEEKLRKYAAFMMAYGGTSEEQGKSIPMSRWQAQGLIATIENSAPGKVLGNYGLATMDRKPVSLADYRGKVVMLDFWATWCKPCLASMPSVRAFTEEMEGKPFEVLGVNYGDSIEKAQAFHDAGEVPMPWTHLHQETNTEEYFRWSLGSIPTYIVLDEKGVVIARGTRFDDEFKQTIRTAVAAVKPDK